MALPPEFKTPEASKVFEQVRSLPAEELAAFPPLDDEDLRRFGAFIQIFCFIDFNLRRVLEAIHVANLLPSKALAQYPDIPDAALTDALAGSLKDQPAEANTIQDTIKRLDQIKHYRGFRNLIAHFAMKRHPTET